MESQKIYKNIFKKHDWEISIEDFKKIIEAKHIPIIDVREPNEVAVVRVDAENFVNIPLKELETALIMNDEEFQSKYSLNKPEQNDPIILVCRSGRRSNLGLKVMREHGYLNTRHFNGGTNVWMEKFPDEIIKSIP